MRWQWDERKSQLNKQKHGLRFETAQSVFDDDLRLSRLDLYADEERWHTIGMIDRICVLVVHTLPADENDERPGRIISARLAKRHERKDYEERGFS